MDWNNDGLMDLICGNYYGKLFLFRRLADGTLTEEPELCSLHGTESYEIDQGYFSTPQFVDWDENGYVDLVMAHYYTSGTGKGRFSLFMNTDDYSDSPVFTAENTSKISGVSNRWRRGLEFADLDLDGDKDMIMGDESGYVYFSENVGTNSAPSFDGIVKLQTLDGTEIDLGSRTREEVFDWNADGYPDLVVGEKEGGIYVLLGVPPTGTYSTSQEIAMTNTISLSFNENPSSSSTINASLSSNIEGIGLWNLYDINGRMVSSGNLSVSLGQNSLLIDSSNQGNGTFILRVIVGNEVISRRVVVTSF